MPSLVGESTLRCLSASSSARMSQLPMCDPSPSTERARAKVESSSCVHFSWASLISPPWYPMALAGSVPAKYGLYDRCTNRSSILRCSATRVATDLQSNSQSAQECTLHAATLSSVWKLGYNSTLGNEQLVSSIGRKERRYESSRQQQVVG